MRSVSAADTGIERVILVAYHNIVVLEVEFRLGCERETPCFRSTYR